MKKYLALIFILSLLAGIAFFLYRGGTPTPPSSPPSAQSSLKLYSLGEDQKTLLPPKTSFKAQDQVKFILTFKDSSTSFFPFLKTALAQESTVSAQLLYNNEEAKDVSVETKPLEQDKFSFSLQPKTPGQLHPGQYQLKVSREVSGQTQDLTQDFSWGVLAINPNKSIYTPGEIAKLGIGVLNDHGRTICNANITLEITDPDGIKTLLNEENGAITKSGQCKETSVTNVPDYLAGYKTGKPGIYKMHLETNNGNGVRGLDDSFEVLESVPFDIERSDFPMRIYPPALYQANITVKANQDFVGVVEETVPASFSVIPASSPVIPAKAGIHTNNSWIPDKQSLRSDDLQKVKVKSTNQKSKVLTWEADWKKGQTYTLSYSIKFPQISPEFYLVGPLTLSTSEESTSVGTKPTSKVFRESRQWQIASDAVVTQFMEPGTDATRDLKLWTTTTGSGTITSDTTVAHTGPRSIKVDSGAGNNTIISQLSSGIADSGTRVTAYFSFTDLPNAGLFVPILAAQNSGSNNVAMVRFVVNTRVLQLVNGTTTLGTGTRTLSAGTWYRISVAYVITSTTDYTITVWLNGNQEITVSNSPTLAQTTSDRLKLGWIGPPGANKVMNFDDVYVDNSTALTDTGDIRVTAKLPASDNTGNFDTAVGASPGAGSRYTNINEQPLSVTNGWRQNAAGQVSENYGIQSASAGDVNLSDHTQVAYGCWIYGAGSATDSGNAQITCNGTGTAINLTTTNTAYASYVDTATYPTDAAAVGMLSTGTTTDTILYEAGIVFAYLQTGVSRVKFNGIQMQGIQVK